MSNSCQLLVVITTSSRPFSVTSQVIPFSYKQHAENAKASIERELNGFGTGVTAKVILMEGMSD